MCPKGHSACGYVRDRRSASIIYYRPDGNAAILFSHSMGGIVVAPDDELLLCGYAADGGTRKVTCNGAPRPPIVWNPHDDPCIPGCVLSRQRDARGKWLDPEKQWCDAAQTTDGWCDGKPFHPSDFGTMLRFHRQRTAPGVLEAHRGSAVQEYNEVVLNAYLYADR